MPAGFSEFEHCLNNDDVDVDNDEFQLQSTSGNGVCITSLSINGNPILVGVSNNLQSFWIDSDEPDWWDSELIPRFTKIFENWENFTVIVLGIKNSAFTQNLSPNAHPGAE